MTTHLTLEDGRVFGASNGVFDFVLELIASELAGRSDRVPDLAEWLLEQRCEVQGAGVGYLDMRELSPLAAGQVRAAYFAAYGAADMSPMSESLRSELALLREMWTSIARGEPPSALTSPYWKMEPWDGGRRGPGW